jgi:hypothetical protein
VITLIRPATVNEPAVYDDFDEACIYCRCRPNVSWCGALDESPYLPDGHDLPDCPDCVAVGTCPICGCADDEFRDLCEVD